MRSIRSTGTKPEMIVRRLAHAMGYRFRLHRKDLAGKPDLVFPSRRAVVFIHGCFWHQHPDLNCKDVRLPKTKADYWQPKLASNQSRDVRHEDALLSQGWRVLVIWECQTKNTDTIKQLLKSFLG